MVGCLDHYREMCDSISQRVAWACALEAVSPKFGNVHPGAAFRDLECSDFLRAGRNLAGEIAVGLASRQRLGAMVLRTIKRERAIANTNVNLGIALLCVPMAIGVSRLPNHRGSLLDQQTQLAEVLQQVTPQDGQDVFEAIRIASPGGIGKSEEMDVHSASTTSEIDLIHAMTIAEHRDQIARQYVHRFDDIYSFVAPVIEEEIATCGDLLWGVREAFLRCLSKWPDSLIARKCGAPVAMEVQQRATELLDKTASDRARNEKAFDRWLRSQGNQLNPGTTADLIAAGVFALLSVDPQTQHRLPPT